MWQSFHFPRRRIVPCHNDGKRREESKLWLPYKFMSHINFFSLIPASGGGKLKFGFKGLCFWFFHSRLDSAWDRAYNPGQVSFYLKVSSSIQQVSTDRNRNLFQIFSPPLNFFSLSLSFFLKHKILFSWISIFYRLW